MLELERLHSHLLAIGLTMESIGFENLFMLCFRNREMVLDVFERTTGNRVLHGVNIVGGVIRNLGPEMTKEVSDFCDAIETKCHDLEKMITGSYTIRQRMQGIGIMSESLLRSFASSARCAGAVTFPMMSGPHHHISCIKRSISSLS